jgi:hypothetical protein
MEPFVHLAVPYYVDQVQARAAEVTDVLRRNLANPLIETIHVLCEDAEDLYRGDALEPLSSQKICLTWLGRRSHYGDLFQHLNRHAAGEVCIVAYSDIFFDETLEALRGKDLSGMFLATAKWDVGMTASMRDSAHFGDVKPEPGPYRPAASQDCWIFKAPLPEFPWDWKCGGSPGDENRLAYEAYRSGLIVANPCLTVKAHHLHESGVRRWKKTDRVWDGRDVPRGSRPNVKASTLEDVLRANGRVA